MGKDAKTLERRDAIRAFCALKGFHELPNARKTHKTGTNANNSERNRKALKRIWRRAYESNRHRTPDRRARPRSYSLGDSPNAAYPRRRPAGDIHGSRRGGCAEKVLPDRRNFCDSEGLYRFAASDSGAHRADQRSRRNRRFVRGGQARLYRKGNQPGRGRILEKPADDGAESVGG